MNLAHKFIASLEITLEKGRDDYNDLCVEFASDLLDWHGSGRLAWIEPPWPHKWRHHAIAVIDGIVHDLWEDEAIPLAQYLEKMGCDIAEYPAEEFA